MKTAVAPRSLWFSSFIALIATLVLASVAIAQDATRPEPRTGGLRAGHALARGDTIKSADIVPDSNATGDPSTIIGWVARRMISEGELLRTPAIGRPVVVKAGSPVSVQVSAGGITVTRSGVALFDAGLGDTVRVRLDTRTQIMAIVHDRNTVIIP